MAYESINDNISYDELNAEHGALRDAESASEKRDEKRDERHSDVADVSAGEQARDAAEWGEGAPACLAVVVFAQRMQRRLQAPAQEKHADGEKSGREHPAGHISGHI